MNKYSNAVYTTHLLLKSLSVKHSVSGLKSKIEDHPEYPSMLAVSDCLTEWQVRNEAYQLDKSDYNKLEFPVTAHLNSDGGSFIVVTSINNGKVVYSDEFKKMNSMSLEYFIEEWSGTVLYAAADVESIEPDYKTNILEDWFKVMGVPTLLIALIICLVLVVDYSETTIPYILLLVINTIGSGVTSLLLVNSIDNSNPFIQNLCSLGKKNGCNAILKSDVSKITSWLSWSEVGFFYFVGTTIALITTPIASSFAAYLNFLALPYTVYSLTYQYRHKNWCVLCCIVQILLIAGAVVSISYYSELNLFQLPKISFKDHYIYILRVILTYFMPIISWYTLKPIFATSIMVSPLKSQLRKFKYNSEIFQQLLRNQPRYAISDELMPVVMGNPNADTIVTIVSNPFCGPCAKAHQIAEDWLSFRDDLQIKIIFATSDSEEDERTTISRHFIALNKLNDQDLLRMALTDWYGYSAGQYNKWAAKYPVDFDDSLSNITKVQKKWCELAEVDSTPTVFVNGYKLPDSYQLEDIKYLVN